MTYYQFEISLDPFDPWSEILSAYLGEIDFEGFYEKDNFFSLCFVTHDFD